MKSAVAVLLLVVSSFAAFAAGPQEEKDVKDIMATLAVWREAALKADAATLDKLFHPDLMYSHNTAKVENKEQAILGATSPATRSKGVEYHDLTTHVYGNTATIHGKFDITTAAGKLNHLDVLMVWLKGPTGWQILARHSVLIPTP